MEDFKPQNESERQFMEDYENMSKDISKKIRALSEDERLPYLKESNPTDTILMSLYLQALKNEDYETCSAAKALLLERGFKIPE